MRPGRRRFRIPIFASLLASSVGLLGLSIASLVALSVKEFRADKENYVFDFASQVAEGVAGQVRGELESEREKLELLATTVADTSKDPRHGELVESIFVHYPEVSRVEIAIDDGSPPVRLYNRGLLKKLGFADGDAYSAKRKPGADEEHPTAELSIAPQVFHGDKPALTLSFALRSATEGAKSRGRVVADIVSSDLVEPFVSSGAAEIYLVDGHGRALIHPDLDKLSAGLDLSNQDIVREALRTKVSGSMAFRNASGQAYLGAYAYIPGSNLAVVSQVSQEKAYAASNRLVRTSLLAAAGLIALMSVVAAFLARGFSAPLVRMAKATERIATGDFKVELPEGSGNEIGDLANSLNRMSAELLVRDDRVKQAQQALVASEKLAAFGQLGAGIAHEVKNPLAGILGFAELAQRKIKPDDPVARYLQLIEKETRRCTDIIGNLLKFARREAVEFSPVDMSAVAAETYKLVNHQLGLKGVQVDLGLVADLPTVAGNANQLQQVILNLCINAGDAMPKGGTIKISTAVVKGVAGVMEVETRVADNGTGIPPEVKAKIFEPFFTTKEPGKGTGLGLSVSFGIVRDHGGSIEVDSTVGKGTTFIIRIPGAAAGAKSAAPRAAAAAR